MSQVITVPVRPERLPMLWLGLLLSPPVIFVMVREGAREESVLLFVLALLQLGLWLFAAGLIHLHRRKLSVTLTADGLLCFPTWFGLSARTLNLSDVEEAHLGSDTLILTCRGSKHGVGWSRAAYGREALAELTTHIGAWMDQHPSPE